MKKNLTFLSLILFFASPITLLAQAQKKANKATDEWRYEVQCMGIGVDGTKLVKVWSYSKKPTIAITQAKKNAVHAMVFQGFAGNSSVGCPTQKPLTNNPALEEQQERFFAEFFAEGGKYMKFVAVSGDGSINPEDRIKVGKEYKIGVLVSVMYDQLRKDLESAGIIKGLSSGF